MRRRPLIPLFISESMVADRVHILIRDTLDQILSTGTVQVLA